MCNYYEFGSVVLKKMAFEGLFFFFSIGGYFVRWGITICANLVEGIMGNMYVILFLIWTSTFF